MPRRTRRAIARARATQDVDATPVTPVAEQPDGPNGFVASAARVARNKITRPGAAQSWQAELWDLYDEVGEYRYAQNWLAQSCSRALIYVEVETEDGTWEKAEPDDVAQVWLDELLASCGGKEEFVSTTALHIGVPGETWLVGFEVLDVAGQVVAYEWQICTAEEFSTLGDKTTITDPDTDEKREITDDTLVLRMWRRHPRKREWADSPSKPVRASLREIVNVSKHISATVDSRLAGNGVLILPNEVSITTADGQTTSATNAGDDVDDEFTKILAETMVATIADRDSAAAVAPVVLRMAGTFISQVRHLTFGTQFDQNAIPVRDNAIKRTALGLDMPPEQLLGTGDMNHWGSWQMEESAVKTCAEPVLGIITGGLTHQFIEPMLAELGDDGPRRRVAYDSSPLILRPNKAADADAAHDRLLISDEAYRSAKGFTEDDAPNMTQVQRQVWSQLLRQGKIDPVTGQIVGVAAGTPTGLAPTVTPIPAGDDEQGSNPQGPPQTQGEQPQLEPAATAMPVMTGDALRASCNALMLRALERAGQRIRTRADRQQLAAVAMHDTHVHRRPVDDTAAEQLLEGAFAMAEPMLAPYGVDVARVVNRLHREAMYLLTTGRSWETWRPDGETTALWGGR